MRPKGTVKIGLKYLNTDQLKQFFKAVERGHNKRDDFLFRLVLFLGLRVSEACQLKLNNLNFSSFQIAIQGLKNGRARAYDLDGQLWRRLKRWLKERNSFNGKNSYLFPSASLHDASLSEQTAKDAFKKYSRLAGLDSNFSIHCLRHSCGILHAKNGESPIAIMLWLRHRSVKSTQVYFEQTEFEHQAERAKVLFSAFL